MKRIIAELVPVDIVINANLTRINISARALLNAEADCPYCVNYMVRKGGATIGSTSGILRYSEWATFRCSKCSAWFVCQGDPANYGTIGSYFVNSFRI